VAIPGKLRYVPPTIPRHDAVGMDANVLLYGLGITIGTGLLIGVLPALQTLGAQPGEMFRLSTRGTTSDRAGNRARATLVVSEVALAFVLLVGAGLIGASFMKLWSVDRGFATEGLLVMSVSPDPIEYPDIDARRLFLTELRDRLSAIPGTDVSATSQVPLDGSMSTNTFEIEREAGEPEQAIVALSVVLENYFEVTQIPVLQGRGFEATDVEGSPLVGVVNEAMAQRIWPGESSLGRRIRDDPDEPWVTVVGVVGNVRQQGLSTPVEPELYLPTWQNFRDPGWWILRAHGDPGVVLALARQAVAEVSPATPVRDAEVLEGVIAASVAVPRFRTLVVVGLAALAGALALLGVFGVVALTVTQRTREIGVRMALGARSGQVVMSVVRMGAALAGGGVALGLAIAVPTAKVAREFLFEVEPTEPVIYATIGVALLLVACAAASVPARRAAQLDLVTVLNSE
jgi:predicted permease